MKHPRAAKKLKISAGAMHARAAFEEAKHKRDTGGKFADKPGAGNDAPHSAGVHTGARTTVTPKASWETSAKTSGVVGADQIKIHVTANPKKAGSASADRFAKYQDGMTADEFIAAGGTREDLTWDRKKGFITIHDPPTYAKLSGHPGSATAEIADDATGRLAAIKGSVEKPPASLAEAAAAKTAPKPTAVPESPKPAPAPKPGAAPAKPEPEAGAKPAPAKSFTAEGEEFGGFGSGKIPKVGEDIAVSNPLHKEGNDWVIKPNAIKDAGKGKLEMMTEFTDVPVKKLEAWQPMVNKTANFKPLPPDGEYPPIEVYKVGDKYIIKQGNHRSVSAFVEGRETIKAQVLDLNAPENQKYINPKLPPKTPETKPLEAPAAEKVTDTYVTSDKPLKVDLPKRMPPNHKYKATELTPLPQTSMADEADKGLKWEYEVEYIKYGGQKWGPGIKNQEDFNTRYKAAPLTYLNDDQYNNLGYTSINMDNLPTFNDVHKQIGHRRDPKAIQDRMFTGITTPPIVLRKGNSLRLMAGQSRIFTGFASGFRVPVKVLDV